MTKLHTGRHAYIYGRHIRAKQACTHTHKQKNTYVADKNGLLIIEIELIDHKVCGQAVQRVKNGPNGFGRKNAPHPLIAVNEFPSVWLRRRRRRNRRLSCKWKIICERVRSECSMHCRCSFYPRARAHTFSHDKL